MSFLCPYLPNKPEIELCQLDRYPTSSQRVLQSLHSGSSSKFRSPGFPQTGLRLQVKSASIQRDLKRYSGGDLYRAVRAVYLAEVTDVAVLRVLDEWPSVLGPSYDISGTALDYRALVINPQIAIITKYSIHAFDSHTFSFLFLVPSQRFETYSILFGKPSGIQLIQGWGLLSGNNSIFYQKFDYIFNLRLV